MNIPEPGDGYRRKRDLGLTRYAIRCHTSRGAASPDTLNAGMAEVDWRGTTA